MLSNKLKELRKTTTLTQSEFAKKIDVARTTYAMYEQGNREPDYETLRKIADYFGVTTDYLLGRSDTPQPTNQISVAGQEITLSAEELDVFNELKKHPIMFHDLATDPEKKVKELIKLYKMKKMFFEEENEEYSDGFGELED